MRKAIVIIHSMITLVRSNIWAAKGHQQEINSSSGSTSVVG
jgi:hypothetical protein